MPQLRIRKDLDEGTVEVNTGDGWRGLKPAAARDMADSYEAAIESEKMKDRSGTRKFIEKLREYADDLE